MEPEAEKQQSTARIGARLTRNAVLFVGIIGGLAIVIFSLAHLAFRHGASDQSSSVASKSGADYCSSSGYGIVSQLTNAKTAIYNCQFGPRSKCVTYEHGIANDETEIVRLLFANTLGGGKPSCLSG